MGVRTVAQALGALALTAAAALVWGRMGAMLGPLARTDYVKLPSAPERANGGAYPVPAAQLSVVLVLLEGADERDVRGLPALRRVWLESRYVPHAAPDAQASAVLATVLCGLDLGPFLFHPVARLMDRADLRVMLGDQDALVARLTAGGTAVHVRGHPLLHELLGASVTKLGLPAPEFAEADPARAAERLLRVSRGDRGPLEGFHLVEIALPPRDAGMARGGVRDKIDDALDRLRHSLRPRQLLVVMGTEAADEVSPEVPVLFVGAGVARGEHEPRPLQDLVATVCMALGAPRPTRALGVPDVDLWRRDDRLAVPVLQQAARDRGVVADHLARELYGRPLPPPVAELERAASTFLRGDGAGSRRQIESVLADQDARLAELRRESRALATGPEAAPIRPELLAGLGVFALAVGLCGATSATTLLLGLALLGLAIVAGAKVEAPLLSLDPYALGAADAPRLVYRAMLALLPVALGWMVLAAAARGGATRTLLSLWNVCGGLAALRLAWFLAYNEFTPGPASPGTLALRSALLASAALVAGPAVMWPAWLLLVPLDRRRAAAPQEPPHRQPSP